LQFFNSYLAEEKILNMRHVLPNGSLVRLSPISRSLFQPIQCLIDAPTMQITEMSPALQQAVPFLHAAG